MAFIGNQPVEQYSTIAKQDITGNGGTTYTLNASVTSPEDIELFINHVRQEPTTSYSVSSTTLTLTEALAASDDCYVVYQGRTVGTKAPGDNTVGTAKIQANAVTTAKIAASAVGPTELSTASKALQTGPSFKAYKTSLDQGNTANGSIKVPFETEVWDTDSCYDTSTSRFTPNKPGYYLITVHLEIQHATTGARIMSMLWKNGAYFGEGNGSQGDSAFYPSSRSTFIVPMNGTTDYVEGYAYGTQNGNTYSFAIDQNYRCTFEGIWMRDL